MTGEWTKNWMNGEGRYEFSNGESYEGRLVEGESPMA